MTAREYTAAERRALAGGLSKPEWDALTSRFERDVKALFSVVPIATQAAALHGLLCGNRELQDMLDTIEATCAAMNTGHER